jgi:hypothetical protein
MEDVETMKWFVSLGVGGILAGMMFFFYRKDSLAWSTAWKGQSEMLVQVVKENTSAITALTERIHDQK